MARVIANVRALHVGHRETCWHRISGTRTCFCTDVGGLVLDLRSVGHARVSDYGGRHAFISIPSAQALYPTLRSPVESIAHRAHRCGHRWFCRLPNTVL